MATKKTDLERRAKIGEDRRARTRSSILRASFEMLGRAEGRSSRIDEICQAAGVSRASFYNYFSSVEELFRATAFDISHDFNDAVRAVIRRVPGGAIRLAFALRYNLQRVRLDPAWGWAMVNLSAGGPIFGEEASRYAMEAIEEGLVTEQFSIPSVAIGYDMVMGSALSAMITLLRSEQPQAYPELMVAQIFRGLGVSETLIGKCTLPKLPDPFDFIATHGMGTERDLVDASPFLVLSHKGWSAADAASDSIQTP